MGALKAIRYRALSMEIDGETAVEIQVEREGVRWIDRQGKEKIRSTDIFASLHQYTRR